jgi:hypothetical protein
MEEGRLASALPLARQALAHEAGLDQILHDPAHRAALHAQPPRELGSGDGLVRKQQIQDHLLVDRA